MVEQELARRDAVLDLFIDRMLTDLAKVVALRPDLTEALKTA